MKVQILVDNEESWMVPYAKEYADSIGADFIYSHDQIVKGDVLVLLSCEEKLAKRGLNKHNLVVHESDLPGGKGWSPMTWQVLEGRDKIIISLFEAEDSIDAGDIYEKAIMELDGSELIEELRNKQAIATFSLIDNFLKRYPDVHGKPQEGDESFYKKRTPKDSELDISKTISEQFNLLRVCDNDRYPAFFEMNGHKYFLKITKVDGRKNS